MNCTIAALPVRTGRTDKRFWEDRGKQFRYTLRLMVACAKAGIPYDAEWGMTRYGFGVTVLVQNPPAVAAIKAIGADQPKLVAAKWDARPLDANYSDQAEYCGTGWFGGYAIAHPSGLALTKRCDVDWNAADDSAVTAQWAVTHMPSGYCVERALTFSRAKAALLLAVSHCPDWTAPRESLMDREHRVAGLTVKSQYGRAWDKQDATRRLREMEAA
jgi:hypothetical protein